MNLNSFLHFIIAHNETIILLTIGLICLLSVYVVFRQVFGPKTSVVEGIDFAKIEDTLKRLLNQTNVALQTVSADVDGAAHSAGATGVAATAGSTEVLALKKELEERATVIEALKKQVSSAQSNDGASAELLAKIKDLEGKLAEYEIIEDDIADLSHYKEENARLKTELEQLKRGGPAQVDQFAATASAPAAKASTVSAPSATDETAAAPSQAAPPKEAVVTPKPNEGVKVAEQPMPTESQKVETTAQEETKTREQQATTAAVEAAQAAVLASQSEKMGGIKPADATPKGDIFAEFSGPEAEGADPLAQLGEIDTNRMLEELKDLNGDLQAGAETLEEPANLDKLTNEAEKLTKNGA